MYDNCIAALVASIGVELVGPYHVLAGKLDGVTWKKCILHYRYFYDPPEMITIIVKQSIDQYHLGYFRHVYTCMCLYGL